MNNRTLLVALFGLFVVVALLIATRDNSELARQQPEIATVELELPQLSDESYDWIGSRIYHNEALGKKEYLTHWNEGEDFPSLGIGHFIWFPEGLDAPFDEQFPAMVAFVRQRSPGSLNLPAWLQELEPFVAPWKSKAQFDEAWPSAEMNALRTWLEDTRQYQARFIVAAFEQRWRDLDLPTAQKEAFTGLLQRLIDTPAGLFAVIDYYNFKGLGNNTRERYQGQGWGLVQVLETLTVMRVDADACDDIVVQFSEAAAIRLSQRVELSPQESNEARWLAGWLKRLDGYLVDKKPLERFSACGFRVTPYVQNPASDAMTIIWLSNGNRAGQLAVWESGTGEMDDGVVFESNPVKAEALTYHPAEKCRLANCSEVLPPYLHQVRVTDLEPGTSYRYQVMQDSEPANGYFLTSDGGEKPLRFVVYADSETEPESTGKRVNWPGADRSGKKRKYPLDQTTGYAQNLEVIQQRSPAFIAIAGDIVQSGGEQRDWDEFWSHNAELAASTPILPALGNHDYYGGPGDLGKYGTEDTLRAIRKYQSYFDLPSNDSGKETHSERYYALKYGVVTLIALDTTNGFPHQSEQDTNWRLLGETEGGHAPDWHPGSEQHDWLIKELKQAQETSQFTFVMFHGAPYSSGVHARKPGILPGNDGLSALPLQSLTSLFQQYGVDAVFNGHDEMYEHSVVPGVEVLPAGLNIDHEIHYFDIGIGGDGLRGPLADMVNPYQVYLAHSDAPEMYDADGVLSDGGKHYGHIEVNIEKNPEGLWQAKLDGVYVFPLMDDQGRVVDFERRLYDDSLILVSEKLE